MADSRALPHEFGSIEMWPSALIDWIALAVVLAGWGCVAFIFWRYPDFRRAFVEHWRPENVAKRMNDWAERNKRGGDGTP